MVVEWLYGSDGRALYCVYVQEPMPSRVTCSGRFFAWSGSRYVEQPSVVGVRGQDEAPQVVEVPAAERTEP